MGLIVEFKVVCENCKTEFQVIVGSPTQKKDLEQGKCPKCKSSNYKVPDKIIKELFGT